MVLEEKDNYLAKFQEDSEKSFSILEEVTAHTELTVLEEILKERTVNKKIDRKIEKLIDLQTQIQEQIMHF